MPENADQAAELLRVRLAEGRPVVLRGAGTRAPEESGEVLSSLKLNRLRFLDPEDMVAGAEAGMTMAAFQHVLREKGMHLPVGPWYPEATLGGAIAANDAGPERLFAGGLRDYLIGIEFVNGAGHKVKAGGKVVKNVTGYDLGRMLIGSRGGLGLITAANFKVLPLPVRPRAVLVRADDATLRTGLFKMLETRVQGDWVQVLFRAGRRELGIGLSGNAARQERVIKDIAAAFSSGIEIVEEETLPAGSPGSGRHSGFLSALLLGEAPPALHIHGVFPTSLLLTPALWETLGMGDPLSVLQPCGGDLHFFSKDTGVEEQERALARLRAALPEREGYLVLERAAAELRWRHHPAIPAPRAFALMRALKKSFDPRGIFRGSFYEAPAL